MPAFSPFVIFSVSIISFEKRRLKYEKVGISERIASLQNCVYSWGFGCLLFVRIWSFYCGHRIVFTVVSV
jgi:hypothetical protein